MRKSVNWILVVLMSLSFASSSFAEETIRLANGEWEPYISEWLKHYGIYSHIVTEAFALEGVKVEYVFLPWARGEDMSQEGELDGNIAYALSSKFKKHYYYSDPFAEGIKVFFHLKSFKFDWNTYEDLKGIEIGATIGYLFGEKFEQAEKAKKILVERVPTDEINFRKLLVGRIQLIPQTMGVGYGVLQSKFKQEDVQLVTHHPKPMFKTNFHIILTKKIERNKRMLKLFNIGLKRLKESGKYDQYFDEFRRGKYIIKK